MSEAMVEDNKAEEVEAPEVKADGAITDATKEETEPIDEAKSEEVKSQSESPETKKRKAYSSTYETGDLAGVLKTSAQEHENSAKNRKYNPALLPESNDPKEIRSQVEFYFGDPNLRQDKFLLEQTGGAANNPVPLDTILTFSRMRRFKSRDTVVSALNESHTLDLTGDPGQEKITRKVAYDPAVAEDSEAIIAKSVYVKGFGDEQELSQNILERFFRDRYDGVASVRLRRTPQRLFKGSVFVEWETIEKAQAFLALEPKPLWKDKHVLKVISKKEYCDQKAQDIRDGKVAPGESYVPGRGRGRGRGYDRGRGGDGSRGQRGNRGKREYNGDRGDRDPDDWKKRREDDRANGFKDKRGRGDRRGGRGGHRGRDDRGPRDRHSNERSDNNGVNDEGKESVADEVSANINEKKRGREEDGAESPPAKKLDVKPETTVDA